MTDLIIPNNAFNIILKPRVVDKNYNVFYTTQKSKKQILLMVNVSYKKAIDSICAFYDKKEIK